MAQKILVCDDSRTIQQAVAVALFEMKIGLVMVSDPAQVISSALAETPKLILLDNRMNREGRDDGYSLCQQIKEHDDLKHIPVIFLAGRSYEPQKGREVGAFDFIEKPFETQMLADKIQAGLSASPGEVVRPKMPTSSGPSDFRATTALPTFSPVDLQNMLPPDAPSRTAPLANVADLAPPPPPSLSFADDDEDLSPPPPPALSFADEDEDLSPPSAPPSFHFGDNNDEDLSPPPPPALSFDDEALPPPPPFGFDKPTPAPPPLSFAKSSPPPLSFNNTADDDEDLSRDEAPLPPSPFGFAKPPAPTESRALKQTPVIPAPTDSPKELPVRELFRPIDEPPRSPAPDSDAENTIVAMPASQITSARVAPPTPPMVAPPPAPKAAPVAPVAPVAPAATFAPPPPDFAITPDRNYLAKALEGSRKRFRRPASAPSSAVEGAQTEYIRQLSQDVITRIAWEVVPELAEIIIREALSKQPRS